MEQQNKYYTPDWNELHLGDIIECWHSYDIPRFEHDIFNGWEIDTLKKYLADGAMRVKYLDQSDIESCGWEQMISNNIDDNECIFRIGNIQLDYNTDTNWLYINDRIEYDKCFKGECKSINELRTIMKWLNIK